MTVVRVPSEQVGVVPRFEFELPEGWSITEAPGVLVRCAPVDDESTSIVVSAVRVDAELDLRAIAVRSLAQQRRVHPDARIDAQRVGRFDDRLTYLRAVTVPAGEPVSQLHALFFASDDADRPVADVFSVVATCPPDRLDDLGETFIDLVASFRVEAST